MPTPSPLAPLRIRDITAPAPDASDTPEDQCVDPAPPGTGRPSRGPRQSALPALILVLALGAAVLGGVLVLGGSEPAPDVTSPPAAAPDTPNATPRPAVAGAVPAPSVVTGAATISTPTIRVRKAPLSTAAHWCTLLTTADIRAITGFEQRRAPDDSLLCTLYLADGAGYLFVSDIPASTGAAYTVRGNSAVVYQSDPSACEVSIALNPGAGVLDIDIRNVRHPRVPLCEAAVNLAVRAFDRLPPDGKPRSGTR